MRTTIFAFGLLLAVLATSALAAYDESTAPALGAGPTVDLNRTSGSAFDAAYAKALAQRETDIAALAAWGAANASDPKIRDYSTKLAADHHVISQKTAAVCGPECAMAAEGITTDRVRDVQARLHTLRGAAADDAYVSNLTTFLQETKDASVVAKSRATTPAIRSQASETARVCSKQVDELKMWRDTGFFNRQEREKYCDMSNGGKPMCNP